MRPQQEPVMNEPLRILLAEDNPKYQHAYRKFFETIDCRLYVVANGIDALYAVADEPFDLILLEVNLPLMDGIAATAHIRAMPDPIGSTPIIALAAEAGSTMRDLCDSIGFDDFIQNPARKRSLLETVQRYSKPAATDTGFRPSATDDAAELRRSA